MTNKEKIERCASSNSLYHFFENEKFWADCPVDVLQTIWRDRESENSLCFTQKIKPHEQLKVLRNAFGLLDKDNFSEKFKEATGGRGNEGRKIMTLHSSSLLSLLCFYNVTDKHPLILSLPLSDGHEKKKSFTESLFEVQNDVTYAYRKYDPKFKSNPSNMDVVLKGDNCTLFLESKFSEYLKNGLVDGINEGYRPIYEELNDFLCKNNLRTEEDQEKGTFKLRADSGNTKNYLQGIKQMISHFMGVCTYTKDPKHLREEIYLGSILYKFESDVGKKNHFDNYSKLYSSLITFLNRLLDNSDIKNVTLLAKPLTYQDVFGEEHNLNFLDDKVSTYYKLSGK